MAESTVVGCHKSRCVVGTGGQFAANSATEPQVKGRGPSKESVPADSVTAFPEKRRGRSDSSSRIWHSVSGHSPFAGSKSVSCTVLSDSVALASHSWALRDNSVPFIGTPKVAGVEQLQGKHTNFTNAHESGQMSQPLSSCKSVKFVSCF